MVLTNGSISLHREVAEVRGVRIHKTFCSYGFFAAKNYRLFIATEISSKCDGKRILSIGPVFATFRFRNFEILSLKSTRTIPRRLLKTRNLIG